MLGEMGRLLVILGIVIVAIGALLLVAGRVPWLGNLPGDISWQRGNFRLYAPITTMIIVSLLLTLILNVIARLFR
ncbi:MAG: DUF2905 domain-containing protein [Caldilineaceae bacterium]